MCSTRNVDLVQSLGADEVIDYTKEDFTETGQVYDLIFDAVGKSSFAKCKGSLTLAGIYVTTVLTSQVLINMLATSVVGGKKAIFAAPKVTREELQYIHDLVEAGRLRPVIDTSYPLSDLAEAHRYAEAEHARGRVIVTVLS